MTTTGRAVTPARIRQVANAAKQSMTLRAGVRLRLFSALAEAPGSTAAQVAAAAGADAVATARLLDGLAALDFVRKEGDRYSNTEEADAFLVEGRPDYQGGYVAYLTDVIAHWLRLDEAVRRGRRLPGTYAVESDPDRAADFMAAMHANAVLNAPFLVGSLDLSGVRRVLDVGGGVGTYSAFLALARPDLEAAVLDLPEVVPLAKRYLASYPLGGRVRAVPGDYRDADYGHGYDLALLVFVIHQEPPETVRRMLEGVHRALNPGGSVVVGTFFVDGSRTSPAFAALFDVDMLVTTDAGRAYTRAEAEAMLTAAGFADVRRLEGCPTPADFLVARRPR